MDPALDLFAKPGRWASYPSLADRIDAEGDCWEWTAGKDPRGYGRTGNALAHRLVYQALVGPIPDGLTLDHLCRNTGCVNPDHLEPVTQAENNRRDGTIRRANERKRAQARCQQGHEFTPDNTYLRANGSRRCLTCHRNRARTGTAHLVTLKTD